MPSKVYSAAVVGVEAFEVEIEVHAGWGNTDKIAVVGLPDTAVKESKDRVTSAICNSGLRWPYGQRITINLAPADVRKEGPSFDLPIAMEMLKLEENNRLPALDAFCISGELALSGQLRPIKGVLSIALEARRRQRQTLIVPLEYAAEVIGGRRCRRLWRMLPFTGRPFSAGSHRSGGGALAQQVARRWDLNR
jgi:magnesium chelatase family protein